jgi:hypothetical protein
VEKHMTIAVDLAKTVFEIAVSKKPSPRLPAQMPLPCPATALLPEPSARNRPAGDLGSFHHWGGRRGQGSVSDLVEKGKGRHHPVSSTKDAPVEVGCRRMTHEEGYQG